MAKREHLKQEGVMNLPTETPRTGVGPHCLAGSLSQPECAAARLQDKIRELERELAAAQEKSELMKGVADRAIDKVQSAEAALAQIQQRANESGTGEMGLLNTIHAMHAIAASAMQPSVQGGDSVHSAITFPDSTMRGSHLNEALLREGLRAVYSAQAQNPRPDLTPGDRGMKWDRRERRNPADNVSIHGMYDMHLFHPIEGATVDEVIANWRQHNSVLQPATVGDRPVDDMGASMLCPAIVLHGNKELRRVGEMVFPYHKGVREACDETKLRAWRDALLADPDIPRLLRERAALSEREPNAKQE